MRKSRTGGIIARLISRTGLDLVAARMFAPSAEFARRYAETIVTETEPAHRATQELIRALRPEEFHRDKQGQRARVLFSFFADRMRRKRCAPPSVTFVNETTAAKRFATRSAITSRTIPAK